MESTKLKLTANVLLADQLNANVATKRMDGTRLPIYLAIVSIVISLFEEAFIKDGKVKINLWSIIGSVKQIRKAFEAIKEKIELLS